MVDNIFIIEQWLKFNKIIDEMENMEVKTNDKDKTLLFLSSLPNCFGYFKDIVHYGKEFTITFDEVKVVVRFNEFQKLKGLNIYYIGEGFSV